MPNELISVIDIARIHGRRKQSIFKLLKRFGIEQVKAPGEGARGQAISYISQADYELLESELGSIESEPGGSVETESTPGVFYLIQLEPEHDPERFKIGYRQQHRRTPTQPSHGGSSLPARQDLAL